MTVKKKTYEKPVIQDLGQILTGSAQMPMGYCSGGNVPSGAVTLCQGGSGVLTECDIGFLFNTSESLCGAGGGAVDDCTYGASGG